MKKLGTNAKLKKKLQEVLDLNVAENAAMDNANNPSASNPFATMTDIAPSIVEVFDGGVDLSKYRTIYEYLIVQDSEFEIYPKETPAPVIRGSAELTLIGGGINSDSSDDVTPIFDSSMLKMSNSDNFDTTFGAINKINIYYDGVNVYYTIAVLS